MLEDARRSEHAKQRAQRAPTQRAQPARDRPTRTQRAPRRLAPLQLACGASTAGIAATTAAGRRERGAAHAQRHQGRRETAPTCEHPLAPTRAAPRARCTCHPALLLDVRTCRQCNSAKFCLRVDLNPFAVLFSDKDLKSHFPLSGNFVPVGQFFSGKPLNFLQIGSRKWVWG